jgi:hypothetical protein
VAYGFWPKPGSRWMLGRERSPPLSTIFGAMTAPQTLTIRSFTDRAEALAHFVLRAGEAPRILAFDDAVGCPLDIALAALEWTKVVGILKDDDTVHAARLTNETAAAVIERKGENGRQFVYLGPRLDAPPMDVFEGAVLFDEPGGKGGRIQPAGPRPGPLSSGNGGRRCIAGAARTQGAGNPPPPALAGSYPCRTRPAARPRRGLVRRQFGRLFARAV